MFYSKDFLNHLERKRYKEKTIRACAYLIYNFERYFNNYGINNVKDISKNEILEYLNKIRNRKNSEQEYSLKITRLQKYFQYLEDNSKIVYAQIVSTYPSSD